MLHLPAVELKENEYIIHCLPYLKDIMGKSGSLELDGKTYKCSDIYTEDFIQYDGYGNGQEVLIVVEDEALNHSDILYSLFAANLSESDSLTSLNALLQQFPSLEMLDVNFVTGETSDTGSTMTRLTSYDSDYLNGRFVIFASRLEVMLIMSLFSLGFILFVVGAVIFAIRQLDDLRSSQRGFRILSILGMNRKEIFCCLRFRLL